MLKIKMLNKTPKFAILAIFFLLFITALFGGNYPFPQNFTYPYGIKATNANTATLSTKYTQWKSTYVTSNGCPVGLRVQRPGDGYDTVSEGIAYGMIIAVYFDDQTTFNGLWQYKTNFNDANGLMHWHISSTGSVAGSNAATDADEDIAFAMIEADKQWGSAGTYDYLTLAKGEIAKIKSTEVDSASYHVKPGDSWDSYEFPAYYMPAYYRIFGEVTGDAGFWNSVAATCASHMQSARNTSSGLVPTNINHDGTRNGNNYDYDSCRVPWRYANDYVWYGDTASKGQIDLMASFFAPKGGTNIVDGYAVDTGNPTGSNHNAAFTGPAACSLMAGPSVTYQTTLNSFYSVVEAMDVTSAYYQGCIQMITLLLLSGNLPDFRHMYTATITPTINLSKTRTFTATVTPTSTITPIPPPTHKLNLTIMNASGSGSCADQMQLNLRIYNYDTVAIAINTLKVRIWLNTTKSVIAEKYNGNVYNAAAGDLGTFSTLTATETTLGSAITYGGRIATKYVDLTFSGGVDIPANGGYLYLNGIVRNADWSSPLDTSCNSYTQMLSTYSTYTNDSHFNLLEGVNLVCEYLDASTQDTTNTGVDPRNGANGCSAPTTPTNTPVISNTFTRTATSTYTRTNTPVPPTVTFTPTATLTSTLISSPTFTGTRTASPTLTWTASVTYTFTPSSSSTYTRTATFTPSVTQTSTVTSTGTPLPSSTSTATRTSTPTLTHTRTFTNTFTPTQTGTNTGTRTATMPAAPSVTETASMTITPTGTTTFTRTATRTPSYTRTITPTFTMTPTFTKTNTHTVSPTETLYAGTATSTSTITPTFTVTLTETSSVTDTHTVTETSTSTDTATETFTLTSTSTYTPSRTQTYTVTLTVTFMPTDTFTETPSDTPTGVPTKTFTETFTRTFTKTFTKTSTKTFTETSTRTFTETFTRTFTKTFTVTSTKTFTVTSTKTFTVTDTPVIPTNTFTDTATVPINTFTQTPTETYTIAGTTTPTPGSIIEVVTVMPVIIYPNPNPIPGTTPGRFIDYTVNRPISKTVFKIYTAMGRLIRRAEDNTPKDQGKCVTNASGVYFTGLARGTYYYVIIVTDQANGKEAKSPIEKLIVQ